ncbi:MAG TPA: tetratricopeptide repeat protein [Candidatus Polarisedimenticolia bacterium]|nr:tetratricopeptide repeat protein [Candidatus Polarisedimenticolia bacterium]
MSTKEVVASFWVIVSLGLLSAFSQTNPGRQQEIESHSRKAAEYLKQNRPDLAVPEFKAIVALDPKNVDARGNVGVLLFFQGDYTNAIPELRATLKLRPALPKIQALLGIGEKRTGDFNAAQRDLEEAFPKVQDEKIRLETGMELIEIYSGTENLDKAAAVVSDLRKLDLTNEAVLYTSYRIYSDLAAESLLSLSVVNPNSARLHQAMAHELAKRGNAVDAIENYRAALKIDPQLPGLHFELAEMLSTLSTTEGRREAEQEYQAALEANPSDEQAECRLGDIALQKDDVKGASQRYSRALQLQPNDPEANIGLAKVFMTMDQPQKAEPLLQQALKLDPTSVLAHFRLSAIYRQTGRPAAAKHEMEEYQKYKEMKEKLRTIYSDLHQEQGTDEHQDTDPKQ